MNILFICDEYPPGKNGGIGNATRTLGRELVRQGHNVYVMGLYTPGYGQADYEIDMGVHVWRLRQALDVGLVRNDYSKWDSAVLKLLQLSGIMDWSTAKSVKSFYDFLTHLVNKYSIDIIEWPDFNNYFKFLRNYIDTPDWKVPVVVKFHCPQSYLTQHMHLPLNQTIFQLEQRHIGSADALVAVSNATATDVAKLYNLNRPIKVLYNGINTDAGVVRASAGSKTIVYTGALTKIKGVHSLMQAWNLVYAKEPNARLKLFGKGKAELFLNDLNSESKSSVTFLGHVPKTDLMNAFSTAAAAVFPSYAECFALAPLEAMSCGCPVIFTKRVSGPELIDDECNGLLIDPDNPEEIAEAILRLINNESLQLKFSEAGKATINKRFTIEQSAKDHILFYQSVLDTIKMQSN